MKPASRGLRAVCLVAAAWLAMAIAPSAPADADQAVVSSPRMGSASVTLANAAGVPWADAPVEYRETTHDFLFGVGMTSPQGAVPLSVFKGLAENGLNFAMPYMPWGWLEPTPGNYSFAQADDFSHIAEMKELGYTLDGHCMIFFLSDYPELVPPYLLATDFVQRKQAVYNHVFALAAHYKGTINCWTINEPSWAYGDVFKMSSEQWVEIVDAACRAVRSADSAARIMVNLPPLDVPDIGYHPLQFLEELETRRIDYDLVGVELYPAFFDPDELDERGYPVVPRVLARLDQFARFGKPVILSEIGVPDRPSAQAQAEWMRALYGGAFDNPGVAGITWCFPDDDPFLPGAGLFPTFDAQPRPVYHALADFIAGKTTRGVTKTDASGRLSFQGYAGDYRVQVGTGTSSVTFSVHIDEGRETAWTARMDPHGAADLTRLGTTPVATVPPAGAFPDVPSTSAYRAAIDGMASLGMIGGHADGRFGPEELVTRQQFAKMIVSALGLEVTEEDFPDPAAPFVDLGPDDPGSLYPHEYVAVCAMSNITRGVDATHFNPLANITRAQVTTMVVRAADSLETGILPPAPAGWSGVLPTSDPTHGANIARAEHDGLLLGIQGPGGTLADWDVLGKATRGEVAQILWNLLGLMR